MSKQLISLALAAIGIPLLGGAALTAANSVSVQPAPAVVLPATTVTNDTRSQSTDNTTANTTAATAGSETTGSTTGSSIEDRVGRTGSTTGNTVDDGRGRGRRGADDPASHDVNDDHGDDQSRASDDSKPHAGVDDHSGRDGHG